MKDLFRNIIILINVILAVNISYSQPFQWALSCGKSLQHDDGSIAIDKDNNIYLVSFFLPLANNKAGGIYGNDTVDFFNTTEPYRNHLPYAFCKLNTEGVFQWVKGVPITRGGGSYKNLRVVSNKHISGAYFTGLINAEGKFDTISFNTDNYLQSFLAKYNSNGICQWSKLFPNFGSITSTCADAQGNVYLLCEGSYIAKFDSSGTCLYAKTIKEASESGCYLSSITCDESGNLFIGGGICLNSNYVFPSSIKVDTLTINTNNKNLLLLNFNSSGKLKWAKVSVTTTLESKTAWGIAIKKVQIDSNSNIYVLGIYSDTIKIGLNTVFPFKQDMLEMVLFKYDSSGNFKWLTHSQQSTDVIELLDLAIKDNDIYVVGGHVGATNLGSYSLAATLNGGINEFIAHYDTSGICIGVKDIISVGFYYPSMSNPSISFAIDTNGNCIIAGQFENTVNFDTYSVTSMGARDVFIAKCPAIKGISTELAPPPPQTNELIIYANPSKGTCNITLPTEYQDDPNLTLQIFDINGHLLQNASVEMESDIIKVDIEQEAKGIYNVILSNGVSSFSGKIVFE